jgi:hypothetical protein
MTSGRLLQRRALLLALLLALLDPFAAARAQQADLGAPTARQGVPRPALPLEPLRPEEKSNAGAAAAALGVLALAAVGVIVVVALRPHGGARPLDGANRPAAQ